MFTLRPYQSALVDRAWENICRRQSTLLVAPTGSGKSVMLSALSGLAVMDGMRVLILAHRHELIEQISRTLDAFEIPHGIIAPEHPRHSTRKVQVASVATLVRKMAYYAPPDLIICDEAHHCISKSMYGRILLGYGKAARLGVTATPQRLSGEGLRDLFGELLLGPSVATLIEQGSLSGYRVFAPPITYTEGLHVRMGDYDKKELAEAADKPSITGNAVDHYRRLAHGKRALAFCVSIKHAEHVAAEFRAAGYVSESIDGTLSRRERSRRVRDFTDGRTQVLTSCDLVSEGFDLPCLEVAILLRPTQSLGLFCQQIGRSLRPYPGKEVAIVLDHAGNTYRHGLPDDEREWSLDGKVKVKKGDAEKAVNVKTCGHCFMAVRSLVPVCPYCAYVFPVVAREIEVVDGDLEEMDVEQLRRLRKQEQSRADTLESLKLIEKARGYKHGWAWNVYQSRKNKVGGVR